MINVYDCPNKKFENIVILAEKAFDKYFDLQNKTETDLSFVSPEEIKQLNKEARNVDSVTDILSFPSVDKIVFPLDTEKYPFDLDRETGRLLIGDLIVCMDRVNEQASDYGNTIERELGYLTIHGLLHLVGYDHIKEEDKKIMRQKEEEIYSSIVFES